MSNNNGEVVDCWHAGVSVMICSRALNGSQTCLSSARRKVMEAVEVLGYVVELLGARLKGGHQRS